MPTLFRLVFVVGAFVAVVYGAMFATVTLVKPQPHEIMEAVALPQRATDLRTGRSAAHTLDSQAAALVHHDRGRHSDHL